MSIHVPFLLTAVGSDFVEMFVILEIASVSQLVFSSKIQEEEEESSPYTASLFYYDEINAVGRYCVKNPTHNGEESASLSKVYY